MAATPRSRKKKLDSNIMKIPIARRELKEFDGVCQPTGRPEASTNVIASWQVMEEAVAGLAHRARNMPCQDAARALGTLRPAVIVADGAGSSAVPELGAQAVVSGMARLIQTLDRSLSALLDGPEPPPSPAAREMGLTLVKHARGLLEDVALQHRRPTRDVRCTLTVMVGGRSTLLWFSVGDGVALVEEAEYDSEGGVTGLRARAVSTQNRGEFAQETEFLDTVKPDDVQVDTISAHRVTGFAAMSDGAAERLVAQDQTKVAERLTTLFERLRNGRLKRQELTQMFYEPGFCTHTTGDDRCLAIAARCHPESTAEAPIAPDEAKLRGSRLSPPVVSRTAEPLVDPASATKPVSCIAGVEVQSEPTKKPGAAPKSRRWR